MYFYRNINLRIINNRVAHRNFTCRLSQNHCFYFILKVFSAFLLTDGRKFNCNLPSLSFMNTLRKVYPKSSNSVFRYSRFLSLYLQYTVFVFVGCSSSLNSSSLRLSFSSISIAYASVLQWIIE